MAVSSGNCDFVVLSSGGPGALTTCNGDLAACQLSPAEAPGTKVSVNGCPRVNGAVKSSLLATDSPQRVPAMCRCPVCPPCPPEPQSDPGPAPCCPRPCSDFPAPLCPHRAPAYPPACCLQPPACFCPHRPWPGRLPHQPAPQCTVSAR